jgi:hypothetical protein
MATLCGHARRHEDTKGCGVMSVHNLATPPRRPALDTGLGLLAIGAAQRKPNPASRAGRRGWV